MSRPAFATPLPQSSRSEILEWRFPPPLHHLVLTGRSRAAWHTSFVIPQLNLLLDAGLIVNNQRPKHIFLTHGHSDHTLLTPAFASTTDPPDIFCPAEAAGALDELLRAARTLDLGAAGPLRLTHETHALRPGDSAPLRRTGRGSVAARAVACDHSVPCLGYVFSTTTQRLRAEYAGLDGARLAELRRAGTPLTAAHETPLFAFMGDTTAAALRGEAMVEWLGRGLPVVITECSFLYEKHRVHADRTRHTLWADLEPVVRSWPGTRFVLMHFSLRYSEEEVRRFFMQMKDPPENIVVWIDGEDEVKVPSGVDEPPAERS